jgi:hypothetical protein
MGETRRSFFRRTLRQEGVAAYQNSLGCRGFSEKGSEAYVF